jgi:hypothetical protein
MQGELDGFTMPVGDFNTVLSAMDTSSRQKIRTQLNSTKPPINWI